MRESEVKEKGLRLQNSHHPKNGEGRPRVRKRKVVKVCIIGYSNYVFYSNGHIQRVRGKQSGIRMKCHRAGPYIKIALTKDNGTRHMWWLHRLICFAFRGFPPSSDSVVRHLDDNPLNNDASNLEWGTQSDNERDKWRLNTLSNM